MELRKRFAKNRRSNAGDALTGGSESVLRIRVSAGEERGDQTSEAMSAIEQGTKED
jgi:hypothetical protein